MEFETDNSVHKEVFPLYFWLNCKAIEAYGRTTPGRICCLVSSNEDAMNVPVLACIFGQLSCKFVLKSCAYDFV